MLSRHLNKIFFVSLFLFGVMTIFRDLADNDFGWHFRYGEYIVNNHQVLRDNTFSYIMPEYKWANSYWLSQLIMYVLIRYTGVIGFSLILDGVFTLATLKVFSGLSKDKLILSLGSLLFFPFVGWFSIATRPLLYSTLFMLLLVYVLLYREGYVKYLPLMFMLWANMHADFTLGLFVFGIYTAFKIYSMYKQKVLDYALLLYSSASVLVTLINPYGLRLWETLLKETHPYQFSLITEWMPFSLDTHPGSSFIAYTVLSGIFIASIVVNLVIQKKSGMWLVLAGSFFFLASLRSVYFSRVLIVVGILSFISLSTYLLNESKYLVRKNYIKPMKALGYYFVAALILISFQSFAVKLESINGMKSWRDKGYPVDAVNYIKQNPLSGNMFNNFNWGGYLIWQLPEYKTFIDGRMTSWREEDYSILEEYVNVTYYPDEYEGKFDRYVEAENIGWVIHKNGYKFATFLVEEKNWTTHYEDNSAIILVNPHFSNQTR